MWHGTNATPATQSGGVTGEQAHQQSQPSAISWTPATQKHSQCHVPRLPNRMEVDGAKCHTSRSVTGDPARHQNQPSAPSASPATQNEGRWHQMPHLPRHHGRPLNAISATPATQKQSRCHEVPQQPHRMEVDGTKCNACHTNRCGVTGDSFWARRPSLRMVADGCGQSSTAKRPRANTSQPPSSQK